MSRNIIIYPNRGTTGATEQPYITFSGASAGTINLVVEDDGSVTFDGDTGSLFGIADSKDGLLSSVNDVSGLPIFQVYDNDYIYMGKWDEPTLIVSGQSWNIIAGSAHTVNAGVERSAIIGGGNITATTSDTTYVDNLNIGTLGTGTSVNNLGVDAGGNVVTGTAGGGVSEATSATTTTVNFTGQTIYYDAGSPTTATTITNDLTGAKLGLVQKIYSNASSEPSYPVGWVLMGDAIYFTSTLNIIYAEWAGGSRVEYWYVQEQ
jgi:hypothetical protein